MKKILPFLIPLLIIVGGYFTYRVLTRASSEPQIADLPPAQQAARRADAQQLVKQLDEVAQDARQRKKTDFSVTATQDQLNTLLQDKLKIKSGPVSDLSAELQPDTMILNGQAEYNGIQVPVVINGNLTAQNGGLNLQVQSLKLGGFSAPSGWKDKAQKAASDAIEKALSNGQKVRFESVKVEKEKLTVTGKTG